ncbi:hypothetical protein D3C76_1412660 [compost metagenome]
MIGAIKPSADNPIERLSRMQPLICNVAPAFTGVPGYCWRMPAKRSHKGVGSTSTGKSSPRVRRMASAVWVDKVITRPRRASVWLQS